MPGPFIFIATNRLRDGRFGRRAAARPGTVTLHDANEPRLIAFNQYVNENHSEVTLVQVHPDAASLEFHMGIIGTSHAGGWNKGAGMDYVLVHGTTQSPAGWQRLAGALTRRGNRVQAVDLPTGQPELLAADAVLAAGQVADTMDHPEPWLTRVAACYCRRSPAR